MNYRHAFHAGNFADVLKHLVLALSLQRLNEKPTPWRYIDTHAGTGVYDLTSDEARRSPEWREGVERIWRAFSAADADIRQVLAPFMEVLSDLNPSGALQTYPGSPLIVRAMARPGDTLRLCELHEESAVLLRQSMSRDQRIRIEQRDGYEALIAYLPPVERRGIVLIDPPFEAGRADRKSDFEWAARSVRKALKRWPEGTYIIWRPVKDIDAVEAFDAEIATIAIEENNLPPEKLLVADLWVRQIAQGSLSAAGVVVINPAFGLAGHLRSALPWLAATMDQTPAGQRSEAGWRLEQPSEEVKI